MRHRLVIVGYGDQLGLPGAAAPLGDRVAGVRRTVLDDVGVRMRFRVGRQTDAARIDDQLAARRAREPRQMRMAAGDQPCA